MRLVTEIVIVISQTIQEFHGRRYYHCGRYFQHKGKRLHRAVWEHFNGPVPPGFHVHHLDHDTGNNQPNNLGLLRDGAHLSHHSSQPERKAASSERMRTIVRPKADEWHGSPEGLAWHSKQGKTSWANRVLTTKTCEVCGRSYETYYPERARFCHQSCKAVALRRRRTAARLAPAVL